MQLRPLLFVTRRRHPLLVAAIDDRHLFGAELHRLHRRVDRGHAAAEHDDATTDRQRRVVARLAQPRDERDRVAEITDALVGKPKRVDAAQADAAEQRVAVAAQVVEQDPSAERVFMADLEAAYRW